MAIGRSTRRWVVIVGLLLTACGRPASPVPDPMGPYVLRLDAQGTGAPDGRGQAAWTQDAIAATLAGARWFRAEGGGPQLAAVLRYERWQTEQDVPVLRAHLQVEPDEALAARLDGIGMVLDAVVELERRDHTIELRRDLPIAVERAVALVDAKVTIARGAPETVGLLLHDPDPEVVLVALDGVERRGLRRLGDEVHALLDHDEERVAMRAVECLGVVGGPEHTPGLLRAARLADRAHANRLYEALAKLGGAHARGFLEFAARNEEDPELAGRAYRALARLDAVEPRPAHDPVARGHRQ